MINLLQKKSGKLKAAFCVWVLVLAFFSMLQPSLVRAAGGSPIITQNPPATSPPAPTAGGGTVQQSITKLLCTPSDPTNAAGTTGTGASDIYTCINRGYQFIVVLGSIGAVFWIVLAGYLYMASDGSQESITKAKEILVSTVAGMFIILMTYVFLRQLNPSIVHFPAIDMQLITNAPPLLSPKANCLLVHTKDPAFCDGLPDTVGGSVGCTLPIDPSKIKNYNGSVHKAWGDPACEGKTTCHRTVHDPRNGDNSPPPEGAVDLAVGQNTSVPVYAPIPGKVYYASGLGDSTGGYITITSNVNAPSCVGADACASLAHINPSVKVGDIVTKGQQVGVTTSFSGSLGSQLHFELKLNGQWILGDGKKGTWTNQVSACNASNASGGGGIPAGMVAVKGIAVDMQYASASPSSNNFMKEALYTGADSQPGTACYMTSAAAVGVEKAQAALDKAHTGWKIKAWDCYRPVTIQQKMYDWAKNKYGANQGLVAVPGKGNHPQGLAIDATLVDANGTDVQMPTYFDYYEDYKSKPNEKQRPGSAKYNATSATARANRKILVSAMQKGGLEGIANEWWHFDYTGNIINPVADLILPPSYAPGGDGTDVGASPGSPGGTTIICVVDNQLYPKNIFANWIFKIAHASCKTHVLDYYNKIPNDFSYLYRQDDYADPEKYMYGSCPGNTGGTIAQSGCGVVATSMVISSIYFKQNGANNMRPIWADAYSKNPQLFSPPILANIFANSKYRVCGSGSKPDSPGLTITDIFSNYTLQKFGGNSVYKSYSSFQKGDTAHLRKSTEAINEIINNTNYTVSDPGGYVIADVGGKLPWAVQGHFVVAFGYIGNYQGSGKNYYKIADPWAKSDVVLIESELFAEVVKGINYLLPN